MKILLADDDPKILTLLRKVLEKEKFSVETCEDGKETFEKAKNKHYDAIILDIMMPGKSGFDVIASLRSLGNDTPILVISAKFMVEDRIHAINIGADEYMVKTFSVEELIARLRLLIRRSAKSSTNFLYCNDLVVNMSDMSVKRKNKNIHLTQLEFNILKTFLKNKNKVLSRNDIAKSIWSKDKKPSSNAIDVHIRYLREKIAHSSDCLLYTSPSPRD